MNNKTPSDPDRRKQHWHLDLRVNVAMLLTVVMAIGGVYAANERSIASMEQRIIQIERWVTDNNGVAERLGRIEEGQSWIKQSIQRIENKLRP